MRAKSDPRHFAAFRRPDPRSAPPRYKEQVLSCGYADQALMCSLRSATFDELPSNTGLADEVRPIAQRGDMGRLTESEFAAIVDDVAGSMRRVESASASGFTASIRFASNSGKQSVRATLSFDDETGRCTTIYCPYHANLPHFFADKVESRIQD